MAGEVAEQIQSLVSSAGSPPRYRHLILLDSPRTLHRLLEESHCTFLVMYHHSLRGADPEMLKTLDRLAGTTKASLPGRLDLTTADWLDGIRYQVSFRAAVHPTDECGPSEAVCGRVSQSRGRS
mmetsp:Transcript_14906/g.20431  ORF Transcript_14906/g.20431 Transcript_14906/m.20431 type:complete len:124 (+) Transcript_14906:971-1342(+)